MTANQIIRLSRFDSARRKSEIEKLKRKSSMGKQPIEPLSAPTGTDEHALSTDDDTADDENMDDENGETDDEDMGDDVADDEDGDDADEDD